MITRIVVGVAVVLMLSLGPSVLMAQTDSQPSKQANNGANKGASAASSGTKQEAQTMMGCIRRGEASVRFKLETKDGTWDLVTGKLKINSEVDHVVTVSGSPVEDAKPKKITKITKLPEPKRRGLFKVDQITMVGEKCEPA